MANKNVRVRKVPVALVTGTTKAGVWLGSIRLSGFSILIMSLTLLGMLVLAPNIKIWIEQRQVIADLQADADLKKSQISDLEKQRARWDDPAYVRAQARDRLYYVMPGEVSYLVMDADGVNTSDTSGTVGAKMAADKNNAQISSSIYQTKNNWVDAVLESVIRAGVEQPNDKNIVAETQGDAKTKAGN